MMPSLSQTASEALWGLSFSAADPSTSGRGREATSVRIDDDVVALISDETVASEAAPLVFHNPAKLAFCGGVSGALAKTCTAPLARLTILYQVRGLSIAGPGAGGQQMGVLTALRHIAATEGICALWKGNLVTIMHRIPYSSTNFFTYELTKQALKAHVPNDSARAWASGAVSGFIACTAAYPLDLLRTRIAAEIPRRCGATISSSATTTTSAGIGAADLRARTSPHQLPQYGRLSSALSRILSEQGLRGLYKGLGATLVQAVPGLAFNFCFYDTFKGLALQYQQRCVLGEKEPHVVRRGPQQHVQSQIQAGDCAAQVGYFQSTHPLQNSAAHPPHTQIHHHHRQQQPQMQQWLMGEQQDTASAVPACSSSDGCCRGRVSGGMTGGPEFGSTVATAAATPLTSSPDNAGAAIPAVVAAPPSHSVSALTSAVCACLSGLCTSSLTFPLDVVRRRLQVYECGALGRMRYLDVVRAVYSEGGVAAFYRGLRPEFVKVLPGMAIAFTTYETLKQLMGSGSS